MNKLEELFHTQEEIEQELQKQRQKAGDAERQERDRIVNEQKQRQQREFVRIKNEGIMNAVKSIQDIPNIERVMEREDFLLIVAVCITTNNMRDMLACVAEYLENEEKGLYGQQQ